MENSGVIKFEGATHRQINALIRFAQRINMTFEISPATDSLGDKIRKGEADIAAGRGRKFTLEEFDMFVNAHH